MPGAGVPPVAITGITADSRAVMPGLPVRCPARRQGRWPPLHRGRGGARCRGRAGAARHRVARRRAAPPAGDGCRAAPRARPPGRGTGGRAAGNGGRRHRHQRQDQHGRFPAPARRRRRRPASARWAWWRRATRRARADHAGPGDPGADPGRPGEGAACGSPRWRRPPTGWTSSGWTACGWQRPGSPISRATIWTTTARCRPTARPSCGCSPSCCRRAPRPSRPPSWTRRRPPPARHRGRPRLGLQTVGEDGDAIRLLRAVPHAGGQHLDLMVHGARRTVELTLPGRFQADNALLAAALAQSVGVAGALDRLRR